MPPKKQRLKRSEFNRFFRSGRRVHGPCFTVVYSPYSNFHASVVVSKKVSRKAVERNKVRRRTYAALTQLIKETGHTGVFIVVVKPSALEITSKEAKQTLRALIGRVTNTG